ncbi:hypothetical protein [Aliarcobacter butzleri]|uniref:hypothetical protein n=1 Tax=Aliarcobacter butzleri TaxID=28197 RepID=UPI003B22588E
MNDFLKDLQHMFMARVKNMLLLNFIIAWCIVNYKIVLRVIFEDTNIDNKLAYLEPSSIGIWYGIIFPLIIAGIYIYLIPLLNLYVVIGYNKFVNKKIQNYKVEAQKEEYQLKREVERERLETTDFLKETMNKEKKALQLKQEKEEIALEERKIEIFEQSNKLKEQENRLKEQENRLKEQENKEKNQELNLKIKENELLHTDYDTLIAECEDLKKKYNNIINKTFNYNELSTIKNNFDSIFNKYDNFDKNNKDLIDELNYVLKLAYDGHFNLKLSLKKPKDLLKQQ